jgi:hypothetical protein
MADVTFRDFAMLVMQQNIDGAVACLETLLGLGAPEARAATTHFQARATDPAFLPKAMGLRAAVTSGTDQQIGEILVECFGLDETARATAVAAVRTRYPSTPSTSGT